MSPVVEQYDPVKTQLSVTCYLAETQPFIGDGKPLAEALGLNSDFSPSANVVRAMMHRGCVPRVFIALTDHEFDCICPCHDVTRDQEEGVSAE